jgi:hypothetical protein
MVGPMHSANASAVTAARIAAQRQILKDMKAAVETGQVFG